jgi:hypothetical protein
MTTYCICFNQNIVCNVFSMCLFKTSCKYYYQESSYRHIMINVNYTPSNHILPILEELLSREYNEIYHRRIISETDDNFQVTYALSNYGESIISFLPLDDIIELILIFDACDMKPPIIALAKYLVDGGLTSHHQLMTRLYEKRLPNAIAYGKND